MPAITISLESSSSDEGEQQLRDDEAFARRLQAEEDAAYAAELQGADAPAGTRSEPRSRSSKKLQKDICLDVKL